MNGKRDDVEESVRFVLDDNEVTDFSNVHKVNFPCEILRGESLTCIFCNSCTSKSVKTGRRGMAVIRWGETQRERRCGRSRRRRLRKEHSLGNPLSSAPPLAVGQRVCKTSNGERLKVIEG